MHSSGFYEGPQGSKLADATNFQVHLLVAPDFVKRSEFLSFDVRFQRPRQMRADGKIRLRKGQGVKLIQKGPAKLSVDKDCV